MTDLEQRLRDELQKISERADPGSIRPLRVRPARGHRRLARWLTPVAAVAAVLAVIGGVYLAGHTPGRASHPPKRPSARLTAPPPGPAAPDVMPPYYVVVQEGPGYPLVPAAVVRSSRTGKVLASVRLPKVGPASSLAISAAADDRTVLITDGNDLFLLRLTAGGRPAGLSRLPLSLAAGVPPGPTRFSVPVSAALSPDGRTVALEGQSSCGPVSVSKGVGVLGCRDNAIRLVSLVTGASRTWSMRALWQPGIWISWDGNDHVLFSWAAASKSGPQASGYRLLNVAGPGSDLLAARRLPLAPLPVDTGASYTQSAFVTPDGSAVVESTFGPVGPNGGTTVSVVELSARTGRLVRVLLEESIARTDLSVLFKNEGCSVLAIGPGGVHALVECTTLTRTVFGRVDDGRFTRLPGLPYLGSSATATAAW